MKLKSNVFNDHLYLIKPQSFFQQECQGNSDAPWLFAHFLEAALVSYPWSENPALLHRQFIQSHVQVPEIVAVSRNPLFIWTKLTHWQNAAL